MQYILNHRHVAEPHPTKHVLSIAVPVKLPETFDISDYGPPIWDQGQLGSCTAHGTLRSAFYAMKRHHMLIGKELTIQALSRAFVYANTRLDSGEPISKDDGGTVRDAFMAIQKEFTVEEDKYPYIQQNFFNVPSPEIYTLAKQTFKFLSFAQVPQTLYAIKHAIFYGRPVVFGAQIYDSFLDEKVMQTGVIPYPDTSSENLQGGHCICLVGWNDTDKTFLLANSWSTNVGLPSKPGYFTIPYDYIVDPDLCSDFWFCDVFY